MRPALFVPPAISWRCPFLGGLCRRHEMPPLQLRRGHWLQIFAAAPSHGAISRAPAGAAAPQSRILWGRGLFERSACPFEPKQKDSQSTVWGATPQAHPSLRSGHAGMTTERHLWGRAWAPMVLGPFAETPFFPLAVRGRNPAFSPASCGAATPRASRSLSVILANARIQRLSFLLTKKRQKPWIPDRGLSSTEGNPSSRG